MTAWCWVDSAVVNAIHDRQLAEHGGLDGVRDMGAVESALAKPLILVSYGKPDAADLAAAYAYGLARSHGYMDGNKRTAWVVSRLFLVDNGYSLSYDQADAVQTMEALAAGTLQESQLAEWFRQRLSKVKKTRLK